MIETNIDMNGFYTIHDIHMIFQSNLTILEHDTMFRQFCSNLRCLERLPLAQLSLF